MIYLNQVKELAAKYNLPCQEWETGVDSNPNLISLEEPHSIVEVFLTEELGYDSCVIVEADSRDEFVKVHHKPYWATAGKYKTMMTNNVFDTNLLEAYLQQIIRDKKIVDEKRKLKKIEEDFV